ncbi:MAG TPA: hypothetical protein VJP84_01940 [Steroidobacteraceae bacterium]|nr:hypothetical protein [Steroidobacteraceae bacterium]
MTTRTTLLAMAATTTLLLACASQPENAPASPPQAQAMSEAEQADLRERKFQEAAKGYKIVQKEGRTFYCKREKVLGSTIPTLQCMSEAQLRLQVENMDELRERMRSSAKCTLGRDGGGGGGCGGS